ncbi:protein SDA1 homolog [Lampetra fluviatilis]
MLAVFAPQAGKPERSEFTQRRDRRNPNAGSTNAEKRRGKPFLMRRHSRRAAAGRSRSFREKQVALRDALLKKKKQLRK